jgi:hypothetical protein
MRHKASLFLLLLLLIAIACQPPVSINSFSVTPHINRCPGDTVRVSWEVSNARSDAPTLRANHETTPDLLSSGTVVSGNSGMDVQVTGPDDTTISLSGGGAVERSQTVTFFRGRVFHMNLNGTCRPSASGDTVVYEPGRIGDDISPRAVTVRLRNFSRFAIQVTHRGGTITTPATLTTIDDPFGPTTSAVGDYVVRPLNQPVVRCPATNQPPLDIPTITMDLEVDCR